MSEPVDVPKPQRSAAGTVAFGILSSRIMGLVRERATAYFFGIGAHADILRAALKMPNLLQNLLGEGTISASFIPVYCRLQAEGREEDAGRFAGAVFGLLLALAAVIVVLAILLAEPIVAVMTPGFLEDAQKVAAGTLSVDRYALTVKAVRFTFPMTGILVLSAWALGVLNSHRRFFLPYFAPVLWNAAIIGGLVLGATYYLHDPLSLGAGAVPVGTLTRILFAAIVGALVGGLLQFLVQLPLVLRVLKGFRISFSPRVPGVRQALRAFGPVVAGRGAYQISGYLDTLLASLLAAGALSALGFAQMLYILPVSLFGMSVAASELPTLSNLRRSEVGAFVQRVDRSLRQILFLTVPTAVGYLIFGLLVVGALYQNGRFGQSDNWLVYTVLGGYSLGLVATTMSRLLQNAFYALNDTRTPALIAVLRVLSSTAVALPLMFMLDGYSISGTLAFIPAGSEVLHLGAVGLAVGASVGAWIELWRLHHALRRRIERFSLPWRPVLQMTGLAVVSAVPAALVWWAVPEWHVVLQALAVVGLYGVAYLALSYLTGVSEMQTWAGRLLKRRGREATKDR